MERLPVLHRSVAWRGAVVLLLLLCIVFPLSRELITYRTPQGNSFSILTYNVQARPFLDDLRARRNLPIIGENLNAFELAGVQECFSHGNLLLGAADHESRIAFQGRQHWWSLANSGLASFSRFPVRETKTLFFRHKGEIADSVASKGVLLMRCKISGEILDVYNTHMQAGNSASAQEARAGQAMELADFIERNSPPAHAVILHGDFNMSPPRTAHSSPSPHYANAEDEAVRTAIFAGMQGRLRLRDVAETLNGSAGDDIDRILYRSGTRLQITPVKLTHHDTEFRDAGGASLSDSPPISARFDWSIR